MARGLPELKFAAKHDGIISVAGNAPSLKHTWLELRGDVLAVNGAYDYLKYRTPVKWAMFWDPSPQIAEWYLKDPIQGVRYLVASQCHPAVFDALAGFRVTVWHVWRDTDIGYEPRIGGGPSAVLRGAMLARALGASEIDLHGIDASLEGDVAHVGADHGAGNILDVKCAGRWFRTTGPLAIQVAAFEKMIETAPCPIRVHGDGLIPHVARLKGVHALNIKENIQ